MFGTPLQPSLNTKLPIILKVQRSGFLMQVNTAISNGEPEGSFDANFLRVGVLRSKIVRDNRFFNIPPRHIRVVSSIDNWSKPNGDTVWMHVNWQDDSTTDDEKFDLLEDHIKNGAELPSDTWVQVNSSDGIKYTYSSNGIGIKQILITTLSRYKIINGVETFFNYAPYIIYPSYTSSSNKNRLTKILNFGFIFRVAAFKSSISSITSHNISNIFGDYWGGFFRGNVGLFQNYPNLEEISFDLFNTNNIDYENKEQLFIMDIINLFRVFPGGHYSVINNLFFDSSEFYGFRTPHFEDTTLVTLKPYSCFRTFQNTKYNNDFVSSWDMSECIDTSRMFENCPFNQNINNWDVRKVRDMSFMFRNNTNFVQPIHDWHLENLTTAVEFMTGKSWQDFPGNNDTEKKQNATNWLDSIYLSWPRKIKLNSQVPISFGDIPYSYEALGSYQNVESCGRAVLTNRQDTSISQFSTSYSRTATFNTRDTVNPRRVRISRTGWGSPVTSDFPKIISSNKQAILINGPPCFVLKGLYYHIDDTFSGSGFNGNTPPYNDVFIINIEDGSNIVSTCNLQGVGPNVSFGGGEVMDGFDWFVTDGGFLLDSGETISISQYRSLSFLGTKNSNFNFGNIQTNFPYEVTIEGDDYGFEVSFVNNSVRVTHPNWPIPTGIYIFKVKGVNKNFEFECRIRVI